MLASPGAQHPRRAPCLQRSPPREPRQLRNPLRPARGPALAVGSLRLPRGLRSPWASAGPLPTVGVALRSGDRDSGGISCVFRCSQPPRPRARIVRRCPEPGINRLQKAPEKSLVHEHTTFGHLMQWPKVFVRRDCTAGPRLGRLRRMTSHMRMATRESAEKGVPLQAFAT